MHSTADIRLENRNRLRRILWQGGEHTKQTLSRDTGLSVATCSTLLNEMEADGEAVGAKRRLGDVGRSSVVYRANEEKNHILCLHCDFIGGRPVQSWAVMTLTGRILQQNLMQPQESITAQSLCQTASSLVQADPAIDRIMLGIPGVVEEEHVRYCDIPALTDQPLRTLMQQETQRDVHMENDMHYRIYGYAGMHAKPDDVLTLCNWNAGVVPGVVTFHKGMILTGQNLFAGCAVLLPEGSVESAVLCLISLLNPGVMVLSGDRFTPESIPYMVEFCQKSIPQAYLPRFAYAQDTEDEYLSGMRQRALDLKCLH